MATTTLDPPPPAVDLSGALRLPLSGIMARSVVCARPDMDLGSLVRLMVGRSILGMPVVDAHERPVGMVSQTDLIRDRCAHVSQPGALRPSAQDSATVEDVMTPLVFSLPETATVAQAAALMVYEGIHRIPVISLQNRVVGIVCPLDILRLLAQLAGFKSPGLPQP